MSARNSDRNLLFGILALQMDFISRESLVKAMNDWVLDKEKSLGEILVANEILSKKHRDVLDQMVDAHVEAHDGDPEKSLAALSSVGSVRDELASMNDSDVREAMTYIPTVTPATPNNDDATITHVAESKSLGEKSSLNTRFRIIRPHAEGGLGKVSVAMDRELNREVALKEIKEGHVHDESARTRFTLEAEITGGLEHPGIVPVYGLGHRDDGQPFYAMRFIKGDSLKDACAKYHERKNERTDSENALEFRKLLGRFIDVCNAIEYAHSRGVLHRDLKPGNIMLGKYGETLVVDWGLAKAIGRDEAYKDLDEQTLQPSSSDSTPATQMGSALGTPQFMSPEQAAGRLDALGPASDVYSLGATLYYLLVNRSPFTARNLDIVLAKVQMGEVEKLLEIDPELPKSLVAVCEMAMAIEASDRYRTPSELAAEIDRWLADEPVSAGREPVWPKAKRWARRHPKVVASLGATILVSLATAVIVSIVVANSSRSIKAALNDALDAKVAESNARQEAENETRRYRGLQLLSTSLAIRDSDPALSVLLATECTKRYSDVLTSESLTRAMAESVKNLSGIGFSSNFDFGVAFACFNMRGDRLITAGSDIDLVHYYSVWDLSGDTPNMEYTKGINSSGLVQGIRETTICMGFRDDKLLIARGFSDGDHSDPSRKGVGLTLDNSWTVPYPVGEESPRGQESMLPLRDSRLNPTLLKFDSKCRFLAAGYADGSLQLWNIEQEEQLPPILEFQLESKPSSLHFGADGELFVAVTDDGNLICWAIENEQVSQISSPNFESEERFIHRVAVDPNDKQIICANDSRIELWKIGQTDMIESTVLGTTSSTATSLAVSRSGNTIYAGTERGSIFVWRRNAELGFTFLGELRGHSREVRGLVVNADEDSFVSFDESGELRSWDLTRDLPASLATKLFSHADRVSCVAVSPDSDWIASGAIDGSLRITRRTGESPFRRPTSLTGHQGGLTSLVFDSDSQFLLSGGVDGQVRTWRLSDLADESQEALSQIVCTHSTPISSIKIGHHSNLFVSSSQDSKLRVWNMRDSKEPEGSFELNDGDVASVIFIAKDERVIVCCTQTGRAYIWVLDENFEPSDVVIIDDDLRRRFDFEKPTIPNDYAIYEPNIDLRRVGHDAIVHIVVGGSGRIREYIFDVGYSNGGSVFWIGPQSPNVIMEEYWDSGSVESLISRADGSRLAAADGRGAIRIYRPFTPYDEVFRESIPPPDYLYGHSNTVEDLEFSRDGKTLISRDDRGIVFKWDLDASEPELTGFKLSEEDERITCVRVGSDGTFLVWGNYQGDVKFVALSAEGLLPLAQQRAGRNMLRNEWDVFFPDMRWEETFPGLDNPNVGPRTSRPYEWLR